MGKQFELHMESGHIVGDDSQGGEYHPPSSSLFLPLSNPLSPQLHCSSLVTHLLTPLLVNDSGLGLNGKYDPVEAQQLADDTSCGFDLEGEEISDHSPHVEDGAFPPTTAAARFDHHACLSPQRALRVQIVYYSRCARESSRAVHVTCIAAADDHNDADQGVRCKGWQCHGGTGANDPAARERVARRLESDPGRGEHLCVAGRRECCDGLGWGGEPGGGGWRCGV